MDSQLIKNIAFLGTTGSGKSSTCNTLSRLNPGPFTVGHDEVSCTNQIQEHLCSELSLRVIDMLGFQDHKKTENQVSQIIQQLILKLADPTVDQTHNIDAFVLVCKLDPRPSTLKKDLERMKELFGTVSLKSTILLVIYNSKEMREKSDFFSKFQEMSDITRILREAKQEDVNENWFCVWDNIDPVAGQEEEFLRKIQKLEPYTYTKYLESQKEAKVLIDRRIQDDMEREIARLSREHENDQALKKNYIREYQKKFAREKEEILKATEVAQEEARHLLQMMEKMQEEDKATLKEFYQKIKIENEENEARNREILKANESSLKFMNELMEINTKIADEQNKRLLQLVNQIGRNGSTNFLDPILGVVSNTVGKVVGNKCNMF